jgi:hypothetical protein
MDRINNLLNRVPGYSGYRDKENRRDSDKRVRDRIVSSLEPNIARIESIAADLANRREIMSVGPVDTVAKSARHLQDQIRTATYGYGGIGSDRHIDATALDQLVQFDTDLLAKTDSLGPLIDALATTTDDAGRLPALSAITAALTALRAEYDERAYVIETGRPSTQSTPTSPLNVLETDGTKPLPRPAMKLKKGDAISIAGANFIIDASIVLEGPQPSRILRIDIAPERWLIVNERFAADTTRAAVTIGPSGATVGGQTLTAHGSGSAEVEVTGLGGTSNRQTAQFQIFGGDSLAGPIAFVLTWPTTSLQLAGQGLALDDIEIYGEPGNR